MANTIVPPTTENFKRQVVKKSGSIDPLLPATESQARHPLPASQPGKLARIIEIIRRYGAEILAEQSGGSYE